MVLYHGTMSNSYVIFITQEHELKYVYPDKPLKFAISQRGFIVAFYLHCILILFMSMMFEDVNLLPTIW